jgi:GDP-4-dehydro-6-deoxy-D-mannose reductase
MKELSHNKILITGINGFAASHLARYLVNEGNEVHGTVRVPGRNDLYTIRDIEDKLTLHLTELTDFVSVETVLNKVQPDEIYHLAAQTFVKASWDSPLETYNTNICGTVNLFEVAKKLPKIPKILVTSTSEVYGETEGAQTEDTIPAPNTHYGISKYAQDLISRFYCKSFNMPVVITRAANITGSGRGDHFVDSSFAKQIAEIEKGVREPVIRHGNLETSRDFIDAKDTVRGYVMSLRSEKWGEVFCLGSGKLTKIKDLLNIMISLSTIKTIKTEVDPKRLRPVDTPFSFVDAKKANKVLGWYPKVPLKESLKDLLDFWRERL